MTERRLLMAALAGIDAQIAELRIEGAEIRALFHTAKGDAMTKFMENMPFVSQSWSAKERKFIMLQRRAKR